MSRRTKERAATAIPSSSPLIDLTEQGEIAGGVPDDLTIDLTDDSAGDNTGDITGDITGQWSSVGRLDDVSFQSGSEHRHGRYLAQGTLATVLAFALLFGVGMTLVRRHVETSLTSTTQSALQLSGIPKAKVTYEGRDATVRIPAGVDPEQVAELVRTAKAPDGAMHFAGPRTVRVIIDPSLGEIVVAPPVESATMMAVVEGDKIIVEGVVQDETLRQELITSANASFGRGNVTERIVVKNGGIPSEPLGQAFKKVLTEVANQNVSSMQIDASYRGADPRSSAIEISGSVPTVDAQARLVDATDGVKFTNGITVAQPDPVIPEEGSADIVGPTPADSLAQTQIALNELVGTQTIEFRTGRAALSEAGRAVVDEVARLLLTRPGTQVVIVGHTDNQGNAAENQRLSEQRAATVLAALAEEGVPEDSMTSSGKGADDPVADNDTAAGRAENRRITFTLR